LRPRGQVAKIKVSLFQERYFYKVVNRISYSRDVKPPSQPSVTFHGWYAPHLLTNTSLVKGLPCCP